MIRELREDAELLDRHIDEVITPDLDKLTSDVEDNRNDIETNGGDIDANRGCIQDAWGRIDDLAHRVCLNHDGLVLFCHRFLYATPIPEECKPILFDSGDRLGVQFTWNGF
jgi:hypothetical protein